MISRGSLYFCAYIVLFVASVLAMIWWQKRRRKTRFPLPENIRLLHAAGESSLKELRKYDEHDPEWLMGLGLLPPLLILPLLIGAAHLPQPLVPYGLLGALLAGMMLFYLCTRKMAQRIQRYSDRYLGYFGERVVAEALEPLKRAGWLVFHDLPAQADGRKFNLDHVAVGPQGVFVLETKTRRKGKARPGREEHKVIYTGKVLDWPWGEDQHGLDQAERNAAWLVTLLKQEIGEEFRVRPVLVLPGWFVVPPPPGRHRPARVTNHKTVVNFISAGPASLSEAHITAVGRILEARCRDIEYCL